MSTTKEGERPLWRGWGVIVRLKRGALWSHPDYCAATRRQAIRKYDDNYIPEDVRRFGYRAEHRRGKVRCVRVELRATEPSPCR